MHQFSANEAEMLQALDRLSSIIKVEPSSQYERAPQRHVGRIAYLPIEIAGRELYGKAKMAGELVRRDFQVILGATWNVCCNSFLDLLPGIVLLKTLNALDGEKMRLAQNAGHLTIALDEEIFPLRPKVEWYRAVTDENALRLADMICAPGNRSQEMFRQITDAKVEVTGSPRSEFPAIEAGEDILVCTMAGVVNGKRPLQEAFAHICKVYNKPLDGDLLSYFKDKVVHEWSGLALLLETVEKLAARFPNRRIRLRPHPAENLLNYRVGSNVVFDSADSFLESLNGAAVLVFVSGCSTGIETFLAEIPSVRLGAGGHGLSCDLHVGASTANEAVAAVERQIQSPCCFGDLTEHYAPVSLAEKIDALQQNNATSIATDVEELWRRRKQEIRSQALLRAKFPDTSNEQIAVLTGTRVKTIGWNTWLLQ